MTWRKEEWLVLPVFALPLLFALGLHLWARHAHESDLDAYRLRGQARLAEWLDADGGPAADLTRSMAYWTQDHEGGWVVPVRDAGRTWEVMLGDVDPELHSNEPWVFEDAFPAGLSATALANPAVRLQIETGTAPAAVEQPGGVDVSTRVLLDLLRQRNKQALREAPLPAASKAWVLERWHRKKPHPWIDAARELVQVVTTVGEELRTALPFGTHTVAGHVVMVNSLGTMYVLGERARPRHWVQAQVRDPSQPGVLLAYSVDAGSVPGAPGAASILWQGRSEAPLAGMWTFVWEGGEHWWQAARFKTWLGAGIAVFVLLLAVPVLLWWWLRRRRRLDEARTRFINELAHDLRTPLTSLRLHAEMLGAGRAPEARRGHYLGLIERESTRLSALLSNLLDLSRLDGVRAGLHVESVEVAQAIRQAAQAFVAVHPEREDDLTVRGDDDVRVQADAAALARIFGNLLENAGKFTQAGTAIRITWRRVEGSVVITIADEGPGIAPAERKSIFDRYTRGHAPKQDGVPGTGLGLALVRELATRMEGHVRLLPSTRGASFRIRLPESPRA